MHTHTHTQIQTHTESTLFSLFVDGNEDKDLKTINSYVLDHHYVYKLFPVFIKCKTLMQAIFHLKSMYWHLQFLYKQKHRGLAERLNLLSSNQMAFHGLPELIMCL